jgi:hypothetical protein
MILVTWFLKLIFGLLWVLGLLLIFFFHFVYVLRNSLNEIYWD